MLPRPPCTSFLFSVTLFVLNNSLGVFFFLFSLQVGGGLGATIVKAAKDVSTLFYHKASWATKPSVTSEAPCALLPGIKWWRWREATGTFKSVTSSAAQTQKNVGGVEDERRGQTMPSPGTHALCQKMKVSRKSEQNQHFYWGETGVSLFPSYILRKIIIITFI